MARRIAPVEDDHTIRQNYVDALTRAGYDAAAFGDRASASKTLGAPARARHHRHRVGADVDGGFDLAASCAQQARLPIIFLSARDSDFDIVSGLRLGADDYLTKDVSLPYLLARISALFRRVTPPRSPRSRTCSTGQAGLTRSA
jgi:two-component system OmpR family response regulator